MEMCIKYQKKPFARQKNLTITLRRVCLESNEEWENMRAKVFVLVILLSAIGCEQKTVVEFKWDPLPTGTAEDIYGIFFHNDKNAWAVTSGGAVLHTEDGSKTWSTTNLGEIWLEDVFFLDKKNGFVVGSHGSLFHTGDGGQTWTDQSLDTSIWFYDIGFWNDDEGVLVGAKTTESGSMIGSIFTTKDGGESWQEAYNDMSGISDLFLIGSSLGWVGSKGAVGSTTDGGENWEKNILTRDVVVRGSFFLTGQTGWIVGHSGFFASTTDGGWSWPSRGQLTDRNLYAIAFVTVYDGIAVGEDGRILVTTNGGASWAVDSSFVKATLRDIEVIGEQMWICGDGGTLIHVHE